MATMNVKDAAGDTVAIEKPLAPGRAAASASRPVALSNEDFALLDGLETAIASTNTKLDTVIGHVDGLETSSGSGNTLLGAVDETAPGSDTASAGLNGRLQRIAQRLTSLIGLLPTALGSAAASASLAVTASTEDIARIGATDETAASSDTATSGLNGRLQRIAQRITSLIALVPASLGAKTASGSFAVTTATDDALIALHGAVTETAPASDTASSGLNGRLQRIAQRLSSLIALVPTALTGSGNFKTAVSEALPAGTNNIGDVDILTIAAGDNNIGNVDIVTVPADPFGANADAASATGSISAKLRGIATALGVTALDLGSGTGGTRTLRFFRDTAQWVGGSGANGSAVQRVTVATDDTLVASLATKLDTVATKLDETRARTVQVVPTCDATACAQYDVLAATEVITNLAPANDVPAGLRKIAVARLDSATGVDIRIWLLKANSSVGSENAAFAPADADADDLIDYVDFVAADFVGPTGMVNCFAKKDVEIWCQPASGTRNVYFAIQVMASGGIDLGAATDLVVTFQAL